MKTFKGIILGLLLIVLGIILGGNALGLFDIDIFFDGWWTLFIIIPCLISIFTDDDKKGSIIGLIIGILLLLACQKIIEFEIIWKLLLPIIIIVIGLSLIFKNTLTKDTSERIKELNNNTKHNGLLALFSEQNIKVEDEYNGDNITAIFGSATIDLRKAIIKNDIVINTTSVFGGIDIIVPDNVIIKVQSSLIFGDVDNKAETKEKKNSKTIYINSTCVFGGVDIK